MREADPHVPEFEVHHNQANPGLEQCAGTKWKLYLGRRRGIWEREYSSVSVRPRQTLGLCAFVEVGCNMNRVSWRDSVDFSTRITYSKAAVLAADSVWTSRCAPVKRREQITVLICQGKESGLVRDRGWLWRNWRRSILIKKHV